MASFLPACDSDHGVDLCGFRVQGQPSPTPPFTTVTLSIHSSLLPSLISALLFAFSHLSPIFFLPSLEPFLLSAPYPPRSVSPPVLFLPPFLFVTLLSFSFHSCSFCSLTPWPSHWHSDLGRKCRGEETPGFWREQPWLPAHPHPSQL